ncbi:MAG: hypothetical protein VCB25_01760 [Myxococcota bacterium]
MTTRGIQDTARTGFRAVEGWLFDPIPAYSLVLCRVGLGLVLFLAYLSRWPLVELIYGPSGYAGYDYHQRFPENAEVGWAVVQNFNYLQYVSSATPIWILYFLLLASSLCFALGIRPKITGSIAFAIHVLFVDRNPGAAWGWSIMIRPFLLYTILGSRSRHWSLPRWLRERRGAAPVPTDWTCAAWPIRLYQIHLTCVFLVVWGRLDEQSWLTGQMLASALVSRDFGRFDVDWYPYFGLLEYPAMMALILEIGAPFLLWIKPIGKFWALALIGMFFTLAVTTSIGWWDFMVMLSLLMFLPPDWLAWVMRLRTPRLGSDGAALST